jgi:protein FAM50
VTAPVLPILFVTLAQILNKTRGKTGPLFQFDAHDDVRLLADATREKDEVRPRCSRLSSDTR